MTTTDIDGVPNAATYRVSYRLRSEIKSDYLYAERVGVIPGVSTFGDIPQVIASTNGHDVEDIVIFGLTLNGLTDEAGNRI